MKNIFIFLCFISFVNADLVIGVVPQQSPLKLLKIWQPITEYLSEKTAEKIIFKTEKSISKFEKVLYSGGYDFAYMNPYHYVVAHNKQNYVAKVRAKKNIKGILLVKKGEKIDFKNPNNHYLFPSPNAFAATLLTKYDLVEKYGVSIKNLNKSIYVNSHDSVYKGVSRGIGNIGGGIVRTFNSIEDLELKNSLKIIHTTSSYPSHPIAFKNSLKKSTQDKIISALLSMPKELLSKLKIKELKTIKHDEYKTVRELAIKLNIMPD